MLGTAAPYPNTSSDTTVVASISPDGYQCRKKSGPRHFSFLQSLGSLQSQTKPRLWWQKSSSRGLNSCPSPAVSLTPEPVPTDDRENQHQVALRPDRVKKVGLGLFRSTTTSTRQSAEKRQNLVPNPPGISERRALSAQRYQRAANLNRARPKSSPPPHLPARIASAPPLLSCNHGSNQSAEARVSPPSSALSDRSRSKHEDENHLALPSGQAPSDRSSAGEIDVVAQHDKHQIEAELDVKWILNLSMHFRDRTDREKFFVTFAETPNRWRRVTISCDYRDAEFDSLETDLKGLRHQRDKHAQIYESIRDSLSTVEFYDTVTNLNLKTASGQLHVHVTEDVNETIIYPPASSVKHIVSDPVDPVREARESDITFLSHLSGFVYRVRFQGREYIKKEIPGPDTVDEFLYEINALHALSASTCVIHLEAVVFDNSRRTVKGLLISYAERGAVVDLLYDHCGELPLSDRIRWARQVIQGLSDIHEEGYVQGDFTLSNIVVDANHDAKLIDINRRGCPMGWEPPEFAEKLASNQRISMYIGQKSDLYQLGMTLWALAMQDDEPERHDKPLSMTAIPDEVPHWFQKVVAACLSPKPRERMSAQQLLHLFPCSSSQQTADPLNLSNHVESPHSARNYVQPDPITGREHHFERLGRPRRRSISESSSVQDAFFVEPPSSGHYVDSGSSYVPVMRGRSPRSRSRGADDSGSLNLSPGRRPSQLYVETDSSARSISRPPEPVLRDDGFGLPKDQHSEPDCLRPSTTSITPHFDPNGYSPTSNNHELPAGPTYDCLSQGGELELPGPNLIAFDAATDSLTDRPTPQNTALKVATAPSQTTADIAGCGGAPSLDDHSPHEPKRTCDFRAHQQNHSPEPAFAIPASEPLSPTNTGSSRRDFGTTGQVDVADNVEPVLS